jgi:hypothetical protein
MVYVLKWAKYEAQIKRKYQCQKNKKGIFMDSSVLQDVFKTFGVSAPPL